MIAHHRDQTAGVWTWSSAELCTASEEFQASNLMQGLSAIQCGGSSAPAALIRMKQSGLAAEVCDPRARNCRDEDVFCSDYGDVICPAASGVVTSTLCARAQNRRVLLLETDLAIATGQGGSNSGFLGAGAWCVAGNATRQAHLRGLGTPRQQQSTCRDLCGTDVETLQKYGVPQHASCNMYESS